MMRLIEQIAEVLRESRKEMHVDEIAIELAKKYPHLQIPMELLPQKVAATLSQDIKKKKRESEFSKPKNSKGGSRRGYYRIKIPRSTIPKEVVVPEQPRVNAIYTGKAGEFAVLSELLFFGFNASYMAVDDGIDVIASKDNKYFHVQVKTANVSDAGRYSFTLNQRSYDAKDSSSTFYILVLRNFNGHSYVNSFLVFPNSEVRRLVESGVVQRGEKLSFRVEKDRAGKYLLNGRENVSWALNRFDIIT
jgi:hypothetical protein